MNIRKLINSGIDLNYAVKELDLIYPQLKDNVIIKKIIAAQMEWDKEFKAYLTKEGL